MTYGRTLARSLLLCCSAAKHTIMNRRTSQKSIATRMYGTERAHKQRAACLGDPSLGCVGGVALRLHVSSCSQHTRALVLVITFKKTACDCGSAFEYISCQTDLFYVRNRKRPWAQRDARFVDAIGDQKRPLNM